MSYNNVNNVNNVNNLISQLSQGYYQPYSRQKKTQQLKPNYDKFNNVVSRKLEVENQEKQKMYDKYNLYINSRDRYVHQNGNNRPEQMHTVGGSQFSFDNLGGRNNQEEFIKDLRENINNKMDNRAFDQPSPHQLPLISDIQDEHNMILNNKPLLQSRSKNLYKDQVNQRLNHYSPLSRSSYVPPIAQPQDGRKEFEHEIRDSPRDIMNQRLSQITPLCCNIPLKKSNVDNKNISSTYNYEQNMMNELQKINFNDVNQGCVNVVNTQIPMFTK